MHTIFEKVEDLNKQLLVLKAEFSAFVCDKSIPLDERWESFCTAPPSLTEKSPWVWSFNCVEINWYHDFNTEKHETVSLSDFINDQLSELIEEDGVEREKWEPLIPLLKEEILAANTREFVYDW